MSDTTDIEEQKQKFTPEILDAILGGKNPESWDDLNGIVRALKTLLAERILGVEMTHHLGYEKREEGEKSSANRRNGASAKTLKTKNGTVTVRMLRDRDSSFDPQFVKKHQRRLDGFDEKVNRQIRKVIKTKGSFPSDDAALKLIYLALKNARLSAIMPARVSWSQKIGQGAKVESLA